MLTRTTITTIALALAGGAMWSFSGIKLAEDEGFAYKPNPLGIKRSPYGQVLAMAIQTPIDADWHGGLEIHDHDHEGGHSHDHGHGHGDHGHGDHDHDSCDHDSCDHDHGDHDHGDEPSAPEEDIALLARLERAVSKRNNPNPPTKGHKVYLRQEIEKKLRFAYELDPSHYANYNCYHLFLTQASLGTHGLPQEEVAKMVESLADYTVRYCLAEQNDPRPALTAASAASNVVEQMLTAQSEDYEKMRKHLGIMEACIQQHFKLLEKFIEDGSFAKLSSQRQEEILTRSKFALKVHEAAEEAIKRRTSPETATADAS